MLCAFPHCVILNIYDIMNMYMHTLFVQNCSLRKNTNLVTVLSRKEDPKRVCATFSLIALKAAPNFGRYGHILLLDWYMDFQRNMTNCVFHTIAEVVQTSTVSFVFCLFMRIKSENRKDRGKELVQKDIKEKRKTPLHSCYCSPWPHAGKLVENKGFFHC